MKKKELRGHLGTLAFNMDSQWCVMHRVFLMDESSRDTDEYTNKED